MNIVRTSLIAEVTVLYYVGQYSSDYTYIYFSPIKIERARAFANWPAPLRNARGSKRTGQARNFISILLFIEREKHYGLTKLEMKTVIDFPSLSGKWADKFFQYDFIVTEKHFFRKHSMLSQNKYRRCYIFISNCICMLHMEHILTKKF